MKEILKSVARFVELSKEFTVSSDEVYEGFNGVNIYANEGYVTINSTGSLGVQNPTAKLHILSTPTLSKVELYGKSLQAKCEKAKRYEEYLELQKNLEEYFISINKLNK